MVNVCVGLSSEQLCQILMKIAPFHGIVLSRKQTNELLNEKSLMNSPLFIRHKLY